MLEKNIVTTIDRNIINYLFVQVPCPECKESSSLSLGMIHRHEWVYCPKCKAKPSFFLAEDNRALKEFASSFDSLYAELRRIGLPLGFFHNPSATIWSRDKKS